MLKMRNTEYMLSAAEVSTYNLARLISAPILIYLLARWHGLVYPELPLPYCRKYNSLLG